MEFWFDNRLIVWTIFQATVQKISWFQSEELLLIFALYHGELKVFVFGTECQTI